MSKEKNKKVIDFELNHSTEGVLPSEDGADNSLYLATVKEFNARKAEAILLSNNIALNPLLKIRAMLFKGDIEGARKLIEESKDQLENRDDLTEILNEEARLAAFEGDWQSCLKFCNESLKIEEKLLSRMTLFQIRAIAFFELKSFVQAQEDVEKYLSLKIYFPNNPSNVYVDTLYIKLIARQNSLALAKHALDKTWSFYIEGGLTLDALTALLRCEVDLGRRGETDYLKFALAYKIICHDMGEKLYEGLAVLDAALYSKQCRDLLSAEMKAWSDKFLRIKRLLFELENLENKTLVMDMVISETATGLKYIENPLDQREVIQSCQKAEAIYFKDQKLFYIRKDRKIVDLKKHEQICLLLESLRSGPKDQAQFFSSLWGNQKFSVNLHSSLIRSLLYRARKTFGIPVFQKHNKIELAPVFFVH